MSLNKACLIGNLCADVDLRHTSQGGAVVNLRIATSESWKDKQTGEKQERVEWHRVVVFNRHAENAAQYLKKGSKVYVEGQLRTSEWEKDGIKRFTTEIIARDVQYLDNKS